MLTSLLIAWGTATLGLWLSAKLLDGVRLASFGDAVWAGALLGILQWALKVPLWALLGVGTLGLAFVFFFITRWIVAAIVILIAAKLSSRLDVDGFWNALFTAFIVAVTGSVLQWLV
jgi:putative membrane protein